MDKRFLLVAFGVILLDQASKFFAPKLGFSLAWNKGGAFGLLGQWSWVQTVFHWIFVIGLIFLIFIKKHTQGRLVELGFWLFVAGGVGNTLDRIYFGAVRDFIDLEFWPSFNLADVAISLSAIFLIFSLIKK